MKNEITILDPTEFGLEKKEVKSIEQAFTPKIIERDELAKIYEQLIKKEITPELVEEAKELKNKLVKVRTGIDKIHKTQKAYFLASGRFVDAWKNKETLPVEQMEEKLVEIKDYYINLEAEKVAILCAERKEQLDLFEAEYPEGLGEMEESVWKMFLGGAELAYNNKIKEAEDEAKRVAREKQLRELGQKRKNSAFHLAHYIENYNGLDFSDMSNQEYEDLITVAQKKKDLKDARDKKEREAHARLKREAEIEAEEREAERIANAEKIEAERKKNAKRIEKERKKNAKLQKKIKEQEEAEAKRIADAEAEAEQKLTLGDKGKKDALVAELSAIKGKYTFKAKKNQKMITDVESLIDKIVDHIEK